LRRLGDRPYEVDRSLLQVFLWYVYFPIPIGWVVWFGSGNIFIQDSEIAGVICIILLIAGHISYQNDKVNKKSFDILNKSFLLSDTKRYKLKSELKEVEKKLSIN